MELGNATTEQINVGRMNALRPLHRYRHLSNHSSVKAQIDRSRDTPQALATPALGIVQSLIDCLPTGICLVDAAGTIAASNRVADQCLKASEVLCRSGNRLVANRGNDQAKLRRALKRANDPGIAKDASYIAIASPTTGCLTTLVVAPFTHTADRPAANDAGQATLALVFIVDVDSSAKVGDVALSQLFGLTPSESRLTEALLNGKSVNEYATDASVTINTARSQLKSVFRKTETRRQADLIQRLGRLFFAVDQCAW